MFRLTLLLVLAALAPCRGISQERLSDSAEIDPGPPVERRSTSASRVSSPSAANSTAAVASGRSPRRFGMLLQPREHFRPALAVVVEHLAPPLERDLVEAGLREDDLGAAAGRLELEGNRRARLARVVDFRIDLARVPLPDQPLRRLL